MNRIGVALKPEIYKALKIRVIEEGTSIQDYVTNLIEEALKKEKE